MACNVMFGICEERVQDFDRNTKAKLGSDTIRFVLTGMLVGLRQLPMATCECCYAVLRGCLVYKAGLVATKSQQPTSICFSQLGL